MNSSFVFTKGDGALSDAASRCWPKSNTVTRNEVIRSSCDVEGEENVKKRCGAWWKPVFLIHIRRRQRMPFRRVLRRFYTSHMILLHWYGHRPGSPTTWNKRKFGACQLGRSRLWQWAWTCRLQAAMVLSEVVISRCVFSFHFWFPVERSCFSCWYFGYEI